MVYCNLRPLLLAIVTSILTRTCRATSASTSSTTTTAATTTEQPPYLTYVLEDICHGEDEVISVYLKGWSAAIVTLGQTGEAEYYDRSKHTCTLKVSTDEGFHLGGVVESIRIQGVQDPDTKRWDCEDYIVFRTKSAGIVNQVLAMLLPAKIFKGRESEKLCGERVLDTSKIFRMVDKSTHSNVFSTMANSLELEYHQNQDLKAPVNNSFTVVISTFRHVNEHECSGQVMCGGGASSTATVSTNEQHYCVHERYYCDGHVNCAIPGGGSDERGCPGGEVAGGLSQYSVVFSSTIILFIALGSIVGASFLLVILYTLVARARSDSNRSSPSDSTTAVNFTGSSEHAENNVVPATHRSNRSRHHRRNNRHHHRRDEEEDDLHYNDNHNHHHHHHRENRSRTRGRHNRDDHDRPHHIGSGGGRRGGEHHPRRQGPPGQPHTPNTTTTTVTFENPPQEEKQQQPIIGVNQYNTYHRVNSFNAANPSAPPEVLPYPPSYDILFPTDG